MVHGYQRIGKAFCLLLQGKLVSDNQVTRRCIPDDLNFCTKQGDPQAYMCKTSSCGVGRGIERLFS